MSITLCFSVLTLFENFCRMKDVCFESMYVLKEYHTSEKLDYYGPSSLYIPGQNQELLLFCNLSISQLMRLSKNFVFPYIYPLHVKRICVFTTQDVHIHISPSVLPSWSRGLYQNYFANLSYSKVKAEHPVWRQILQKPAPSSSQNTFNQVCMQKSV